MSGYHCESCSHAATLHLCEYCYKLVCRGCLIDGRCCECWTEQHALSFPALYFLDKYRLIPQLPGLPASPISPSGGMA